MAHQITCEALSPKAQEIFAKLKPYFLPDPWGKPSWEEEGIIVSNGRFDFRKASDRKKLEEAEKGHVSYALVSVASHRWKQKGSLSGFTLSGKSFEGIRKHLEIILILEDLDFQIETMDQVEESAGSSPATADADSDSSELREKIVRYPEKRDAQRAYNGRRPGTYPTDRACVACNSTIMERVTPEYLPDSGPPCIGPGSERSYTTTSHYHCGTCGLTYAFLPPPKPPSRS